MDCSFCKKEIPRNQDPRLLAYCPWHGAEYVCEKCNEYQVVRNFRVHHDAYKNCYVKYSEHITMMYSVYLDDE